MNATDLKSLLHYYLAVLRSAGGAEEIGFVLEGHIARLNLMEVYGGTVCLLDLPVYSEAAPRNVEMVYKTAPVCYE